MMPFRHMASLTLLAVALVFASACEDEVADSPLPSADQATPSKKKDKPAAEAEDKPDQPPSQWVYSPVGKRDPFRSYLAEMALQRTKEGEPERKVSSTEEFELGQYRLKGLVFGTSQPRAMVEDPSGKGHTLRVGNRLGKRGGRVTRISNSGIVVVEEYRDPVTGDRVRVPITIKLPKPALELVEK